MQQTLPAACLVLLAASALPADEVDYARDVQPLLKAHCYECHTGQGAESDLRLDTVAGMLEGGNTGPAVVPGKSGKSLLIERIATKTASDRMPPEESGPPLNEKQIALLRAWIDAGAHGPADERRTEAKRESDHWSFQPVERPPLPQVQRGDWVRSPIDAFILARLEAEGISPSPQAERTTLIRRLSLDLTGLPPSPAELDEFLSDGSPQAYERLVERLLASPHYGERWGRHWLDNARYADSDGYTNDVPRSMWLYRDWVIQSLNDDQPFDQFVIDQLAGDLRPDPTPEQITATGFHRNTQHNREGGSDAEQYRVERVADRVNTTGTVFLGLTIGCARCHDHKFDPVSQREYYQLFAFFDSCDEPTQSFPSDQQQQEHDSVRAELADAEAALKQHDEQAQARRGEWERELLERASEADADDADDKPQARLAELAAIPSDKRTDEQQKALTEAFQKSDARRGELADRVAALKKQEQQVRQSFPSTLVMRQSARPRVTRVHIRGDFLSPGREVAPGVLSVLPPLAVEAEQANRMDLAHWLVDGRNPLTARVMVNRIWQGYFGRGLVETENDFGIQGSPPSHSELLDWLASELVASGWSLKAIHRLIVHSATYRQSSAARGDLAEVDPLNVLLARQSRHRLEAEVIRDCALASSGLLSRKFGGPGVYPPQPEGVMNLARTAGRKWVTSTGDDRYRRGIYTYFWRGTPYPFLKTFDAPDTNSTCTRRGRSNTPLQALMLLNDEAFFEAAQGLAARVLAEAPAEDEPRLRYAFRLCMAREPGESELQALRELLAGERADPEGADALLKTPALERMPASVEPAEAMVWVSVARTLLNLDEFITRE